MSQNLYEQYVSPKSQSPQLSGGIYGCSTRSNKSGQTEPMRDPDATLSIFDDKCFKFYLIKYCEILGVEALLGILGQQILSDDN